MSSIPPKNERKQPEVPAYVCSSQVEIFRSFFGRIEDTIKDIWKLTDLYFRDKEDLYLVPDQMTIQ